VQQFLIWKKDCLTTDGGLYIPSSGREKTCVYLFNE